MTQPVEIPPPSLDDVLFEKREGYAVITLNRPVVLNAINWSIQRRLMAALIQAESNDDVKAVILTGAGRAFSAGGDMQATPPEDGQPSPGTMELIMKIWEMPKPIIAAIRGYAVGQGHEFVAACDLAIATEDAVFGEVQIRHGVIPPILLTPFNTGLKQAKEILMLGERIPAQDALGLGLINKVVPNDELMNAAEEMAKKFAVLSPKAVGGNKLLVNRVYELAGLRDALDYRSDEAFTKRLGIEMAAPDPYMQILREQGWEAFRKSRDTAYGETEIKGPGTIS